MEQLKILMEQQAAELKTIPHTNFLKKFPGISDEENSILEIKYSAPQIRKLSHNEIVSGAAKLLLKIKVITGWILPSGELMAALLDVFVKKLIEDYSNLNFNEIEFVFIKYGTTVEDWGKEVNLNLIDKILIPYIDKRFEVSKIEEQLKEPPPIQKIYTEQEIINERRGEIQSALQAMKKGNYPILHSYFKEILIQDGFMKEEESISDFFVMALATKENLYINDKK